MTVRQVEFQGSSNVRAARLHEASGVVEVEFTSGERYRYAGFSGATMDAWAAAASAGKWFSANVRKCAESHPVVPREAWEDWAPAPAPVVLPLPFAPHAPTAAPVRATIAPLPLPMFGQWAARHEEQHASDLNALGLTPHAPVPDLGIPEPDLDTTWDPEQVTDPVQALIDGDTAALVELYRQLESEQCRRDFGYFYRFFWAEISPGRPVYVENPGTDALITHLQATGEGRIQHLAIACPPGFGKTSAVSVAYVAWMWARDPSWRVICASHAYKLAQDIAGRFLRLVQSDKYRHLFPHVVLTSDASAAIMTSAGGVRYAVGVEGSLTGLRGSAGLIDDSLNAIHAGSPDAIQKVNDWFDQAFSTRFDDRPDLRPSIIVVQQRLDADDLIEHVRQQGAEVLELAARFEVGRRCKTSVWEDPRIEEGEILAPLIHSEEFLEKQLRVLRPHGFAGQYQQRPGVREGNQFKVGMWGWCSVTDDVPRYRPEGARATPPYVIPRRRDGSLDLDFLTVSVDPTGGSLSTKASALGLGIVGGRGLRRFVLSDLTPGPRTFNQQVEDIIQAMILAAAMAGPQPRFTVLIEKKALGVGCMEKIEAAIHSGGKSNGDGELVHPARLFYPNGEPIIASVKPYEPSGKGDKERRADHMEPDVEAGLVQLLDGAPWVPAFLQELGLFPRAPRDDRVDYLSQALDHHRESASPADWATALKNMTGLRML